MKRIARCAGMAVGVLLAAGVAAEAEDRSTGTEGTPCRSPLPAGASSQGTTGTGSVTETTPSACTYRMTGTVKDLDKARGTVEIQIPGEDPLRIHLPASEMSGFAEGDEVVVSMGEPQGASAAPLP